MTSATAKRLRFAYHPAHDESVCGAFVAACHDHRLRSVASGLEGVGIRLPRSGHIQFAEPTILAAAAFAMRTDPASLGAVAFRTGPNRNMIMLGDLAMPRAAIELEVRSIAPGTLKSERYHRSAWLNLLLPYCPESLERLVNSCPDCGTLGWRRTRGIENCETCGQTVSASSEPPLDAELADRYRTAADLMSRDADASQAALGRLPGGVASFSRSTLVEVAIRAGGVAQGTWSSATIEALKAQSAPEIAATVCRGVEILSDWPRSICEYAAERTSDIGDDIQAYDALRRDLRWIGRGSAEGRSLVNAAFPTIDGRTSDIFATSTRYYTASTTNEILWTVSSDLKLLRDAEALRFEKLPSNVRLRARYDAGDVDALRAALDDATTPGAAAVDLDIPTYGVDQIAAFGDLDLRDERGVIALRGAQISARSLRALRERLFQDDHRLPAPGGYVALRTALAAFPGEKPWGRAVRAMLSGQIDFFIDDKKDSIRRIMVRPEIAASLAPAPERQDPAAVTHLSLRDACELLCAGYEEGLKAIRSKGLPLTRYENGLGVERGALRTLAAEVAFTGEAAAYTRRNGVALYHELTRIGVPRLHGAWNREALTDLRLVMPLEI